MEVDRTFYFAGSAQIQNSSSRNLGSFYITSSVKLFRIQVSKEPWKKLSLRTIPRGQLPPNCRACQHSRSTWSMFSSTWDNHSNMGNQQYGHDNHLDSGPVVRAGDQEVCSLCGLRFKPCGCSYDGYWRLAWSLTSGPVGLVEVRASWPGHPR
jgi:hypothetical protein